MKNREHERTERSRTSAFVMRRARNRLLRQLSEVYKGEAVIMREFPTLPDFSFGDLNNMLLLDTPLGVAIQHLGGTYAHLNMVRVRELMKRGSLSLDEMKRLMAGSRYGGRKGVLGWEIAERLDEILTLTNPTRWQRIKQVFSTAGAFAGAIRTRFAPYRSTAMNRR